MALSVLGGIGSKGGGSNPNLLDNPFFTVNQRGQSSYGMNPYGMYTFDRWMLGNSTDSNITKSDELINLELNGTASPYLRQYLRPFEMFAGKTVTLSMLLGNGEIKKVSYTMPQTKPTSGAWYDSVVVANNIELLTGWSADSDAVIVHIRRISNTVDSSVTFKAIKLEFGETSTLALDSAPDYATELLKCQRYFVRLKPVDGVIFGFGYANATTSARISIPVPTTMRTKPTVSYRTESGTNWYRVYANGTQASVSAMSVVGESTAIVTLLITTSTITSNHTAVLFCNNANGYIDLSADL